MRHLFTRFLHYTFFIIYFLFLISYFSFLTTAQPIKVGLFRDFKINRTYIYVEHGDCILEYDTGKVLISLRKTKIEVINDGKILIIKLSNPATAASTLFRLQGIEFINNDLNTGIKIDPPISGVALKKIEMNGSLRIFPSDSRLILTNSVEVDDYVASVVEAESGRLRDREYYKVQAILCRTYALGHKGRHITEGFDLCDEMHCQRYKGICRYPDILNAVKETGTKVVVDREYRIITAAYHSNCGGLTANSSDVWLLQLPYLIPVCDSFCTNERHARWKVVISMGDWRKYLFECTQDSSMLFAADSLFVFYQPDRNAWYMVNSDSVPFFKIRNDWKLSSSFFDILCSDGAVTFSGRGYGHGIGLCQEGSMVMARKGYSYSEIVKYFYTGVFIMEPESMIYFMVN